MIKCEADEKRHNVIRFTHAYCKEGHELLATISRVPNIRICSRVESVGMHVVVMDCMSEEHMVMPLKKQHIDQL